MQRASGGGADHDQGGPPPSKAALYPQHELPVVGELGGPADRFDLLRERFLIYYGYNTARAYWGDLEHWRDWCMDQQPAVDPLRPVVGATDRYLGFLDASNYAASTQRRRQGVLRRFLNLTGQ